MGIMTPTSVIELMPSTNDQIELFSNYIKLSILNSETDFRKFLYQKKLIEKTFIGRPFVATKLKNLLKTKLKNMEKKVYLLTILNLNYKGVKLGITIIQGIQN